MIKNYFRKTWFKDQSQIYGTKTIYINNAAIRVKAALIVIIPIILLTIRLEHGDHNDQINNNITGLLTAKEYSHTIMYYMIFFVIYEMFISTFAKVSHLSLTNLISVVIVNKLKTTYKPIKQKAFAWYMATVIATSCQIFLYFNVMQFTLIYLLTICIILMLLEAISGICIGCYIHNILIKFKIIKNKCLDCTT